MKLAQNKDWGITRCLWKSGGDISTGLWNALTCSFRCNTKPPRALSLLLLYTWALHCKYKESEHLTSSKIFHCYILKFSTDGCSKQNDIKVGFSINCRSQDWSNSCTKGVKSHYSMDYKSCLVNFSKISCLFWITSCQKLAYYNVMK